MQNILVGFFWVSYYSKLTIWFNWRLLHILSQKENVTHSYQSKQGGRGIKICCIQSDLVSPERFWNAHVTGRIFFSFAVKQVINEALCICQYCYLATCHGHGNWYTEILAVLHVPPNKKYITVGVRDKILRLLTGSCLKWQHCTLLVVTNLWRWHSS